MVCPNYKGNGKCTYFSSKRIISKDYILDNCLYLNTREEAEHHCSALVKLLRKERDAQSKSKFTQQNFVIPLSLEAVRRDESMMGTLWKRG